MSAGRCELVAVNGICSRIRSYMVVPSGLRFIEINGSKNPPTTSKFAMHV
jgi:hypothetical protein